MSIKEWDDKIDELEERLQDGESLETVVKELITVSRELVEKLDNQMDKLGDIDEYIDANIKNAIDYDNLVWYLKRDNMYCNKLADWLINYMHFYNKKETIDVWN